MVESESFKKILDLKTRQDLLHGTDVSMRTPESQNLDPAKKQQAVFAPTR